MILILRFVAAVIDEKVYDQDSGYIIADKLNACFAGADYSLIKELDFKRKY